MDLKALLGHFKPQRDGSFDSPVWDSGSSMHGVAILPHASIWQHSMEFVNVRLVPLRLLRPDELETLPQSKEQCWQRASGNDFDLGPYTGQHFLSLPQSVYCASLGRTPALEAYTGYLCRVTIEPVKVNKVGTMEALDFLGMAK